MNIFTLQRHSFLETQLPCTALFCLANTWVACDWNMQQRHSSRASAFLDELVLSSKFYLHYTFMNHECLELEDKYYKTQNCQVDVKTLKRRRRPVLVSWALWVCSTYVMTVSSVAAGDEIMLVWLTLGHMVLGCNTLTSTDHTPGWVSVEQRSDLCRVSQCWQSGECINRERQWDMILVRQSAAAADS